MGAEQNSQPDERAIVIQAEPKIDAAVGVETLTFDNIGSRFLDAANPILLSCFDNSCDVLRMRDELEVLSDLYENRLTVAVVSQEVLPVVKSMYAVSSTPTHLLINRGEVVRQITGLAGFEGLVSMVIATMPEL